MKVKIETQHPDTHFKILDLVYKNPDISQRELSRQLGISLGSIQFCLKSLAKKGWLKVGNFKSNPCKSSYLYLLTRAGILQKSKLALGFMKRKKKEYDNLKKEIDALSKELNDGF